MVVVALLEKTILVEASLEEAFPVMEAILEEVTQGILVEAAVALTVHSYHREVVVVAGACQ